jgi:lipocalin
VSTRRTSRDRAAKRRRRVKAGAGSGLDLANPHLHRQGACHPVGARDALRNRQPLVRPADAFFVRPADRVHMATGVLAALAALAAVATGEGPDTGAALAAGASSCRPVRTMAPFAVDEFVAHRWFVQAQQPIIYLPKAEIYCVTAEYNKTSATSVDVHNYANSGRVNGKVSDSGGTLQAIIPNAEFPSKLEVGPKFLPHLLYGPYWVIAAGGSSASGYDWAVIAGGQPTKVAGAAAGCAPHEFKALGSCHPCPASGCGTLCDNGEGVNNSGLWIFSKDPNMDDSELMHLIEAYVVGNGFDPSVLLRVNQTGCLYKPK